MNYQKKSTDFSTSFETIEHTNVIPDSYLSAYNGNAAIMIKQFKYNKSFVYGQVYHIELEIDNQNNIYAKTLKIFLASDSGDVVQNIQKDIVIPSSQKIYLSLFFSPNAPESAIKYESINFELTRDMDYDTDLTDFNIVISNISVINNCIDDFTTVPTRLGIVGAPGLDFILNKQHFKLNDTGVFEILSDNIVLNFIGFAPNRHNKMDKFFLIDYTI